MVYYLVCLVGYTIGEKQANRVVGCLPPTRNLACGSASFDHIYNEYLGKKILGIFSIRTSQNRYNQTNWEVFIKTIAGVIETGSSGE